MSSFDSSVKYLDIVPARQATLQEAQNSNVPFDKYYGLVKTRDIKKIPYQVLFKTFYYDLTARVDLAAPIGRLLFQYNLTLPGAFTILDQVDIHGSVNDYVYGGFLAIKYIRNGITYRYAIQNTHFLRDYIPKYKGEIIYPVCSFEVWYDLYVGFSPFTGFVLDKLINISLLRNPNNADEQSSIINAGNPIEIPALGFNTPVNTPIQQPSIFYASN